jgi:hypothetical protein
MKQFFKFPVLVTAVIFMAGMASCHSKDKEVTPPVTDVKTLLTAKTWQVNEVNEWDGTSKTVYYKRGAANNEEDYSAVRQQYRADGSIVYTDQEGETGTDGRYELLENNTRLKLSMPDMGRSVTVNTLKVTNGEFSYRLATEAGYVQFTFEPAQ